MIVVNKTSKNKNLNYLAYLLLLLFLNKENNFTRERKALDKTRKITKNITKIMYLLQFFNRWKMIFSNIIFIKK